MTKKGARQRPWTTREVDELREMAGRVPRREICRRLKRSASSVKSKAYELRESGEDVSLRCHTGSMEICPACGHMSGLMGRDGICEACRRAEQLRGIEEDIADLLAALPAGERAVYEATEAERETASEPMPPMQPTHGVSRYEAARNAERNARAMEQWRVRRLRRLVKAAQKRKERIRRKAEERGGGSPKRGDTG